MSETAVIHPKFHHFNLKTTRLQEMIDWYGAVVGAEVLFQDATEPGCATTRANHRVALLAFPGFADDPEKDTRTGHASQRLRVRELRRAQRQLPAPARGRASSRTSASTTA